MIYQIDDGSENAPEDSGFLSDEEDQQERIVNESSLYNEDEEFSQTHGGDMGCLTTGHNNLYDGFGDAHVFGHEFQDDNSMPMIMTARSESTMDDCQDEEIEGISKCKAINSSYINLKRNNLLISYGKR